MYIIAYNTIQQNKSPQDDVEGDSLESEGKRKRGAEPVDPDDIKSYDPNMKTNHFESTGSYTMDLVGQRRILRHTRSVEDHLALPNAVESSMLSVFNHCELHDKDMKAYSTCMCVLV